MTARRSRHPNQAAFEKGTLHQFEMDV